LPISQIIGLVIISYAASRLQPRAIKGTVIGKVAIVGLILVLVLLLVLNPPSMVMFHGLRDAFPMLLTVCVAGLVLAVWLERTQGTAIWLIAIALLIGCFVDYATSGVWQPFTGPSDHLAVLI